jgi:hypothetical protein
MEPESCLVRIAYNSVRPAAFALGAFSRAKTVLQSPADRPIRVCAAQAAAMAVGAVGGAMKIAWEETPIMRAKGACTGAAALDFCSNLF